MGGGGGEGGPAVPLIAGFDQLTPFGIMAAITTKPPPPTTPYLAYGGWRAMWSRCLWVALKFSRTTGLYPTRVFFLLVDILLYNRERKMENAINMYL